MKLPLTFSNPSSRQYLELTSDGYLKVNSAGTALETSGSLSTGGLTEQTPVNAVAAAGALTMDDQPAAGQNIVIGSRAYAWVSVGEADTVGEIDIGANLAASKTALIAAINGTDGLNAAHPDVTAGTFSGNVLTITAKVKGVAGNSIATTETMSGGANAFDAATLGTAVAGVNGTVGLKGAIVYNSTKIWVAVAANTIADANWKSATLA